MRITVRSILNRYILLVPFLLMPLTGCCSALPFGKAIQAAKKEANASDVGLILLGKDQAYFPEKLLVRNKDEDKKKYVIVWIAYAEKLKIEFKDPKDPDKVKVIKLEPLAAFPFICYWLPPSDLPPGTVIKYTATLTCNGKDLKAIDPEVEIVF